MEHPKEPLKTIYLSAGKDAKLVFDPDGYLAIIRLSINKVGELLGNQLVDQESLFQIDNVTLITRNNFKTAVRVNGREHIERITAYWGRKAEPIVIDSKRTKQAHETKHLFQHSHIDLYVAKEERIPKRQLILPRNV